MIIIDKIKKFFNNDIQVTFLDETWGIIHANKPFKQVPQQGDLLFVEEKNLYYEILKIIYYLNNRRGVFIVIKPIIDEIK